MADIVSAFPTSIAMSDSGVQRVADAYVYAATDTAFATPLAITDLQGVPMNGGKLTTTTGQFPQFKAPPGVTQVLVRSGSRATLLTDVSVFAGAAFESASSAALKAGEAEAARIAAAAAQQAAVAAAVVLQTLANQQGVPLIEDTDEPGTFRILNPVSIREDPAEPGTFLMGATS